jgi:(E)-4-hydroxy-3-methylbut-2-enyl-diphosphate synthase
MTIGDVKIGSEHPIAIQTMTTTKTDDVNATVEQIKKCAAMGIDIVRVTVQGLREAKACGEIRRRLDEDGVRTPIVADIHFNPKVALAVADYVDKVRVNPGNFADGRKSFDSIDEVNNTEAMAHLEKVFAPLVLKLKEKNKAMRIGVNHGSLAERILFQYGDSPEGMVAHALEFAEICRKYDYHNFCFSMKASNPKVMVAAYRALARKLYELDWDYPLHLGVTEAGGGADGRIKSASGIGTLLLDGLGDTIRVSLTEDPEYEAKPCKSLRQVAEMAEGKGVEAFHEPSGRREGRVARRKCDFPFDVPLNSDGTVLVVVDAEELAGMTKAAICDRFALRLRQDGDIQKDFTSVDAVVLQGEVSSATEDKIKELLNANLGVLSWPGKHVPLGVTLMHDATVAAAGPVLPDRLGGHCLLFSGTEPAEVIEKALKNVAPRLILFKPENLVAVTFVGRKFFSTLTTLQAGKAVPVMLWFHYPVVHGQDEDDIVIRSSADFGSLFLDGFGEGLLWEADAMTSTQIVTSSFNLLQACRMRISKTEFISCPSCGRTLFDLQEVTAEIQAATGHLPGVRVAIMGCIVNGPGEMADADFGYVGSGVGKIDLYVNYDVVKRGIPSENGVEQLVDLIKEHGRWQDPPETAADQPELELVVPEVSGMNDTGVTVVSR